MYVQALVWQLFHPSTPPSLHPSIHPSIHHSIYPPSLPPGYRIEYKCSFRMVLLITCRRTLHDYIYSTVILKWGHEVSVTFSLGCILQPHMGRGNSTVVSVSVCQAGHPGSCPVSWTGESGLFSVRRTLYIETGCPPDSKSWFWESGGHCVSIQIVLGHCISDNQCPCWKAVSFKI